MEARYIEKVLGQLESLKTEYEKILQQSNYDDGSGLPVQEYYKFTTRAVAAIQRITGPKSTYAQHADRIKEENKSSSEVFAANYLYGVVCGLYSDVNAGYLQSVTELIHGDVFSDFLEMGSHLVDKGYKDAAAVIAGSSLEGHLRALCDKNGVDVETTTQDGDIRRKKADLLNSELVKAGAYEKQDQKSVTAWLDLRNKAAHGDYAKYEDKQVQLMISGVRDFLTRNPA